MHLGFLAAYWWLVLAAMAAVLVVFVLVAGREAEGGLAGRARLGWQRWRALSARVADVQARVILTIFYFTIAAPFGVLRTYFADPLAIRPGKRPRTWHERRTRDLTLDDARRQF